MQPLPRNKSELAHYLGVSLSTVKRWLKLKKLHVPRGIIAPTDMHHILQQLGYSPQDPPTSYWKNPKRPK